MNVNVLQETRRVSVYILILLCLLEIRRHPRSKILTSTSTIIFPMITGADICPIPFIAKAKPDIVEACLQRKKNIIACYSFMITS